MERFLFLQIYLISSRFIFIYQQKASAIVLNFSFVKRNDLFIDILWLLSRGLNQNFFNIKFSQGQVSSILLSFLKFILIL